jgi:hypothetical protein
MRVTESMANGNLIDGGSNVCVTGDLNILLDVVDITPIEIFGGTQWKIILTGRLDIETWTPASYSLRWYDLLSNMLLLCKHGRNNNISCGSSGI